MDSTALAILTHRHIPRGLKRCIKQKLKPFGQARVVPVCSVFPGLLWACHQISMCTDCPWRLASFLFLQSNSSIINAIQYLKDIFLFLLPFFNLVPFPFANCPTLYATVLKLGFKNKLRAYVIFAHHYCDFCLHTFRRVSAFCNIKKLHMSSRDI